MSDLKYNGDTLAHRMKVARAEARMDQQALADAAGISKDSVARYETGRNVPALDKAFDMAVALGRVHRQPRRPPRAEHEDELGPMEVSAWNQLRVAGFWCRT